jgi:hypothetical protein
MKNNRGKINVYIKIIEEREMCYHIVCTAYIITGGGLETAGRRSAG